MIIDKGTKVHLIYRALYESSTRRHFLGEVTAIEGAQCRLEGYAFVLDKKTARYLRKEGKRITIADLGESGYIVNIIDSSVDLDSVVYRYQLETGLVATDDKGFVLDINEFGVKS